MESKIRIKMGQIEIDFEGSESFLKENLMEFVKATSEIANSSPLVGSFSLAGMPSNHFEQDNPGKLVSKMSGTTKALADKLSVKDGPGLIMVAAAHLFFVKGQEKFNRSDLLREMKSASGYYKPTYNANLSKYLNTLGKKNQLIEQSKDTYTLNADAIKDLEAKLA